MNFDNSRRAFQNSLNNWKVMTKSLQTNKQSPETKRVQSASH